MTYSFHSLNLGNDKNEADYDREFFVTVCGHSVTSIGNSVSWSEVQGQVNGTDWQLQQISDGLDMWKIWDEGNGADLRQQSHFIEYVSMDDGQEVYNLFIDIYCMFFYFKRRISDLNTHDCFWIRKVNKNASEKELYGSNLLLFIHM